MVCHLSFDLTYAVFFAMQDLFLFSYSKFIDIFPYYILNFSSSYKCIP